jgi:Sec-independent protein translocase protein TatA
MTYQKAMLPGLSTSELAIVVFILMLVILAARLPRWGEALGSYLYKRGHTEHTVQAAADSTDEPSTRSSNGKGPSGQVPPPT